MPTKAEEDGSDRDWFGLAFGTVVFFAVGVLFLWNTFTNFFPFNEGTLFKLVFGSFFTLAPVLNIKQVQIFINRKTGKQVFDLQRARISGSNVAGNLQAGRDLYFSQQVFPGEQKQAVRAPKASEWTIATDFDLRAQGDTRSFPLDFEKGERLEGFVKADFDVWAYVLSPQSYRTFMQGEEFRSKWKANRVSYTPVKFVSPKTGRFYFVVTNDIQEEDYVVDEDEDEEDMDVSVQVRLRRI